MPQYQSFIQNTPFLCEHRALKQFAQNYIEHYSLFSNQHWTIVCERKEDIISIRNQIFIEIERISNKKKTTLSGISIFSLDTLGQKICASLSHIEDKKTKEFIPKSLFKPYLDITNQENLVELILNLFGYNSSDSLAVSKQILTLLETPLPQDTDFLQLILETQDTQNKKTSQSLNEIALRQILATLQHAQIELAHYARFQVLTQEVLNSYFLELSVNHFLWPKEIVCGPILWIAAPEYKENNSQVNLKPGNFQNYLVQDFKNSILKIREYLRINIDNSIFYDSKTILSNQEFNNNNNDIHVQISCNRHNFLQATQELSCHNNENEFILLADIDFQNFHAIEATGSGQYALTRKDWDFWKKNCSNKKENLTDYEEKVVNFCNEKYYNFIDTFSFLQEETNLNKIAQIYSLKLFNREDVFLSRLLKEKIKVGNTHSLAEAPKVLSYFNTKKLPTKIICLGRPHNVVSHSFQVKILNQVFYLLKQKGIEIEIPASETMYRLYWKNLIDQIEKVEFWLDDKKELEKFPNYIKTNHKTNLNHPVSSHYDFPLKTQQTCSLPNWMSIFQWNDKKVSITQFEDYVHCPHVFYLKYLLKIKKEEQNDSVNFQNIGIKMHKICEQLMTRLVNLFGNAGYTNHMPEILKDILTVLKNQDLFLSFDENSWRQTFTLVLKKHKFFNELLLTFQECLQSIWEKNGDLSFVEMHEREILKRTFLKFLLTEQENLISGNKLKVAIFRELPIQFKLNHLTLSGRIDRIDLTQNGIEIIDYKTSNISKIQRDMTLSPSWAKQNLKLKLSVQGALYSYGFAKSFFESQDDIGEDGLANKIKIVSLYFLKNLDETKDNRMQYVFEQELEKENSIYSSIEGEYANYAQNLTQGEFSPKPIQGMSTCLFCDYKDICPKTYSKIQSKVDVHANEIH